MTQSLRDCRRDLQHALNAGVSVTSTRPIVASLASWARDHDVPPERLLPIFKEMIVELPAFRSSAPGHRAKLMVSLVRTLIEGYYSES